MPLTSLTCDEKVGIQLARCATANVIGVLIVAGNFSRAGDVPQSTRVVIRPREYPIAVRCEVCDVYGPVDLNKMENTYDLYICRMLKFVS